MRGPMRAFILFAFSLVVLCDPPRGLAAETEAFAPVSEKDGVRVSARAVPGSSIKEVRAEGLVEAPPERVLAVLADVSAYPEIMPPTEAARLLQKGEDGAAFYYMVINPPLIRRRDYCISLIQAHLPDGRLRSAWALHDAGGRCPAPQPGLLRIQRNQGEWLLTPVRDGQATQVVYQAYTDPGGQVPAWMVNLATARSLPGVFRSLRRAAALPRYAAIR